MRRLPLYTSPPSTAYDDPPRARDPNCASCSLHEHTPEGRRCASPLGAPGGVLVLLEHQGDFHVRNGRPEPSAFLRAAVEMQLPPGTPLAWDLAVRCRVPAGGPSSESFAACRAYLPAVMRALQPTRVLVMGLGAARAVFGAGAPPLDSARRGYGYTASGVPVFLLRHPTDVVANRFLSQAWREDVAWALRAVPPPPPLQGEALVVEDEADARAAVREMLRAEWFAWDTETFGRAYDRGFRVISVAVCARGADSAYVWDDLALARPEVTAPLLELLADPDAEKTAMNAKYDDIAARRGLGVEVLGSGRDVGLERSLLDPEALTRLEVQQWLVGMGGGKAVLDAALAQAEALVGRMVTAARRDAGLFGATPLPPGMVLDHAAADPRCYAYAYVERDLLTRYNALDTVSTARLEELHQRELDAPGNESLRHVWDELVRHTTAAVGQVEAWGIAINREAVDALGTYSRLMQGRILERLRAAGLEDPGSPDKVGAFLFDKLKLPVLKRTPKGKPSTSEEALDPLRGRHPAVGDILEWRGWDKIRGTYCDGLLRQITDDGRIHVDFRIDGARTGRMSAGGGLHGLPVRSEEGKLVRDCFVAPDEDELVEVDVSQAELRALAGFSGDPVMTQTFVDGIDIHQRTAELIAPRIGKVDRGRAKTVNLALVYGRGDAALAEEMGVTRQDAADTRAAILGQFHRAAAWMEERKKFAVQHGFALTYFRGRPARRRPLLALGLSGDDDTTRGVRGNAERAATNTPVQGSTADIVLAVLVECVAEIKRLGLRALLVLTVHDSLLFQVHRDDVDALLAMVARVMGAWTFDGVPLVFDVKRGRAYGSLTKVRLPVRHPDAQGSPPSI